MAPCQSLSVLMLKKFEKIDYITFSVPYTNVDMSKMLKGIGKHIGVPGECVFVQDYKESFCQYMFYQPKELWQYESALFYCDAQEIRAYMLQTSEYSEHKKQRHVCNSRRSCQCTYEGTGGYLSCAECGQGEGCRMKVLSHLSRMCLIKK